MKINCIAIEDEPIALEKIQYFIKQVDFLNLLKGFDNAINAISFLKDHSVDLIFLDIRMKNLSGIEFLESIRNPPKVIITTAYDEYALKGYELEVCDYLLKPFPFDRFLKSVEKAYNEILKECEKRSDGYIFLKTENRIERVSMNSILFIRGMSNYLQFQLSDRQVMSIMTFKKLMEILPKMEFARVHNSFVVAIRHIKHIEKNRIKIGSELIPVSEGYRDEFFKLLGSK